MFREFAIVLLTAGALSGSLSALAQEKKEELSPTEAFERNIKPLFKKHCYDCHDNDVQKGDLNLQTFETLEKVQEHPEIFQGVLERIYSFEMPPPGKNKDLSFDNQSKLVAWLRALPKPEKTDCDQIASDRNANFYRGNVMSRRINRAEYENSVRDLFGARIPVAHMLPADGGGGEGFDTAGNALFTSSIHIEKYLAAADHVLLQLLPDKAKGMSPELGAARARLLVDGEKPGKKTGRAFAEAIVRQTSARAFRRPVADAETARFMGLFDRAWSRGDGYLPSLRYALKAVLVSPHFLFLVEPEPDTRGVQPLGSYPMASRLSYFLWSSMPDRELLDLAAAGKLQDGDTIRAQIRRMLADPRAEALGERFALQWLDLERLGGEVKPDPQKFPEFTPELQETMLAEVTAFFNYVFKEDRPLTDLIDADYTFINRRLADLYGIEGVNESGFQKVSLSNKNRGGVIGMAAVHTLTSFPLRTSPVLRGRWVLESMLGEKIKPPPPDVPALEETAKKAKDLSLREQLEIHRQKAECASCHDKMDPLGFGMENFDALGRWREMEGGHPVHAKGTLPNGESFTGPSGLKTILMSRKDDVTRHLVRKMTGYAYGRELNKFDNCVVDKAMEALKQNDYKPSVLIEHIALSFPFRHRFYPKIDSTVETNE